MYCQKCGNQIPDDAMTCPQCGALQANAKYCRFCGQPIDKECVVCPKCGKQVEELKQQQPNIVINNSNNNRNTNTATARAAAYSGGRGYGRPINKWVSFLLCVFLGYIGAHKFYEHKTGMGIVYIFTMGLFGIGWLIDCIIILLKPNPYYVYH